MIDFIKTYWREICTLEYGKGIKGYKNDKNEFSVFGSAGEIGTHSEYHLERGVIVSRKGTLDVHYSDKPFFVIDTAFFLKPKPELNAKWAYYALKNFNIKKLTSGTGVPSISRDEFYAQELLLPSIDYQNNVVSILSSIDKKIELNQKMNQTLEEIAKVTFKSWFVDFDPVRAKAEGRSTGLPPEISDLFPDELVASEIGEIPKGWSSKRVEAFADALLGGTPSRKKSNYWGGDISWINSGAVNEFRIIEPSEYITQEGYDNSSTKLLPRKTTVIAITGATLGQVSYLEIDSCANQSVVGVIPHNNYAHEWIYLTFTTHIDRLISRQTGGAQQHINKNNVLDFDVIYPTEFLIASFSEVVSPLFRRIGIAVRQNLILSELRDTLLPKLISGELRIPDAEKFLEEAGI